MASLNNLTKSTSFDKNVNSIYAPFTPRRTFYLNIDDLENTEAFWAITANFPVANAPVTLAVLSGHDGSTVNPVYIPSPGVMVPVCGVAIVSSGFDIFGNPVTTTPAVITEILAYGGSGKTE